MSYNMNDIIYKKREGGKLSKDEIEYFIKGYVAGDIPDYQASALLIGNLFPRAFDRGETFELHGRHALFRRYRRPVVDSGCQG